MKTVACFWSFARVTVPDAKLSICQDHVKEHGIQTEGMDRNAQSHVFKVILRTVISVTSLLKTFDEVLGRQSVLLHPVQRAFRYSTTFSD